MKKILGLDLGVTSIGWALVNEAENEKEKSSIIKLGVRVNPLSVDEQQNFEKGKAITTNADRTLKRSMRRNLQRYKLRRLNLIQVLIEHNIINNDTILSENGNRTTFETYRLRAQAVTKKISLEEFARVLLMINKKRGYRSSRKADGSEEGTLIDGMEVAKKLYHDKLTPGQLCLQLLASGKKSFPNFYRSDLEHEFDRIWVKQKEFYSQILTDSLRENLRGKNEKTTWAICAEPFKIVGLRRDTKGEELKKENFLWRHKALSEKLDLESLAIVLQKINGQISGSSGYLGAISDRSKELYFDKQTVGQYQMAILEKNPNASLRNMVFYRQDYLDEFNSIWEEQAKHHTILTEDLKNQIRDIVIFYQRRLKSQKGLINFCEFESRKIEVVVDGKKKEKTIGLRVTPRSSPLFQEFKIWQTINNIEVFGKGKKSRRNTKEDQIEVELLGKERRLLNQEEKELIARELSIRDKLTGIDTLKLLFNNPTELDINFKEIQGNLTQFQLFGAYQKIIELSGHSLNLKQSAEDILNDIVDIFKTLGYNTDILFFDSSKELDSQNSFRLWHLLYSFEGDNSKTGNEGLINKLMSDFGFEKEAATILSAINFQDDYGNLSAKAIRKILPHLKDGNQYDVACEYVGYRHSKSSLNKEEIENKILKDHLDILQKNSLRNPVVEKILNQMINVVNTLIITYGKPDEIRIELARELKKNAKQREELTKSIDSNTKMHEEIKLKLQKEFGLSNVSRNDIIRYKLYEELKDNGYKTLYSNTYIEPAKLYSKEIDIEHIIPQSRLFDDSLSNKTIELRSINIEKGNKTAIDFVKEKYGDAGLHAYIERVDRLLKNDSKKRSKLSKLKMSEKEIPDGFINRDLGNTQYIAKYAKSILEDLVKYVISTTGTITDRLREDWQLVDVMKELNWKKYHALGLTEEHTNGDGKIIRRIKDWTKRNDHRHHAMDALTIAFTKRQYIQYLNNLNARSDKNSAIYGIEQKELKRNEKGKLLFKPPFEITEFRTEAKKQLENTLISIKSKNKVVTTNINKAKNKVFTKIITQTGEEKIIRGQVVKTPRGQLHLETVYGSQMQYVTKLEKVGANFTKEIIATVANHKCKVALLNRLHEFNEDPKLAFTGKNSLTKNPIYLDEAKTKVVPEKLKTVSLDRIFTIRKEISPDLKLDKIVDTGIRKILEKRLSDYKGDPKKAFSNLDENPIWLNQEKGISIKRVTITGVANAEALHHKKDKEGKLLLDNNGKPQAVDFVNTGNNHHVAVYRDAEGNLQENVISFYEAVSRRNLGFPIIDKNYRKNEGWQFLFSMKQNEYFVFPNEKTGFNPKEIDLTDTNKYSEFSPNLFRVQKIATKDYFFRHHLETKVETNNDLKGLTWIRTGLSGLTNIIKVRIDHIGQIIQMNEY
ncbi:MAG: type II CRISPR RNA-guided endonuclease Cas9 [Crocinitomicaceae bacterium]|nr:type II CRISPR RNA-guided endonuclease Cas9 [Crocinitomicaceae bacterium]MBK8927336.1 type II CRISPR RNA-guided endonuclease Cas9 [Crocinitomicaceae bacterium]